MRTEACCETCQIFKKQIIYALDTKDAKEVIIIKFIATENIKTRCDETKKDKEIIWQRLDIIQ